MPLVQTPTKTMDSPLDKIDVKLQSLGHFASPVSRPNLEREHSPYQHASQTISSTSSPSNLNSSTPSKTSSMKSQLNLNTPKVDSMTPNRQLDWTPSKVSSPLSVPGSVSKKDERTSKFKEKNGSRYSWLLDIKDAEKRAPGDPDYDPRTLYVPPTAWKSFTPFEKQFWEIKAKHWDMVVFFKKGKFYELYEKDADIGHQQFDLKLTDRVNMRMVGVPESSFEYWASRFIAKGHKVAKVDQMENSVGKAIRDRESSKKEEKIIRRELSSVLTAGTLVDGGLLTNDMSTFCMAIKECVNLEHNDPSFGICFVDTATAEFNLTAFKDDIDRTKLETLLVQIRPKELVLEKGRVSKATMKLIKNSLDDIQINYLVSGLEFWEDDHTKDEISRHGYFRTENTEKLPEALEKMYNVPHGVSAFGGLLFYLRTLKLDKELVSAKNFYTYEPVKSCTNLILDGQTLLNLEILESPNDPTHAGTLFKLLNYAVTPYGKRMFRKWVCHPLRSVEAINDRLDAIEDLLLANDAQDTARLRLKKMPDLERVMARIHTGSCKVKDFIQLLASLKDLPVLLFDLVLV